MGVQISPEFAIVGAGVIGLILAWGLVERGIKVSVYEQAQGLTEMVLAWHSREMPLDSDGVTESDIDARPLYRLHVGMRGFDGCHRAHLMEALYKSLPTDKVKFQKRVERFEDDPSQEKVILHFTDGTSIIPDAVIGCDGLKSRVRRVLLGDNHPASYVGYTNKVAYRALVPMDLAIKALGEHKARRQHMHIALGRHLVHYPVAHHTLVNVVAFDSDPLPWNSEDDKLAAKARREDVIEAFSSWNAPVRALVDLFPPTFDRWGIFDTYDHPLPFYSRGRVCVAGDAAHAAAPHHGAGACSGVEDVFCLIVAIVKATARRKDTSLAIKAAFNTFDDVRRPRSQWLVRSSRQVCEIYQSKTLYRGEGADRDFADIRERPHKIWYFDYEGMIKDTITGVRKRLT